MPRGFTPRGRCPFWASIRDLSRHRQGIPSGIVLVSVVLLMLTASVGLTGVSRAGMVAGPTDSALAQTSRSPTAPLVSPSIVPIIPAPSNAPETCANGTPANPFPVAFLPYGYETPNLYGLGSGSVGTDNVCYTGGPDAAVVNTVNFSNVGGAGGVLAYPHVEYGQDLWGGSPGTMATGFSLPETDSVATNQSMWLTNTYSIQDNGTAAYDYVWDNFLSSYVPTPSNTSGPGNFSLEVMLWMTTGYESSPWDYFTYDGSASLPTLINSTLTDQPWDFSYFCQGTNDNELTVLYFYNGTGNAMNTTSRTFGVNFSAVLLNVNEMIHRAGESCWSYPANGDADMYLDDLNLGSEFLTPWPSPYYGTAAFSWTISSMCFRFPEGSPTAANVSCSATPGQPLSSQAYASPGNGTVPLTVALTSSVGGGLPPYQFAWRLGSALLANTSSTSYTFDTPGRYAIGLWVNDSTQPTPQSAHATVNVTVESERTAPPGTPPSSAGGFLGVSYPQWALIGGLVAAAAIALSAILLIRRRRKTQPDPPSAGIVR